MSDLRCTNCDTTFATIPDAESHVLDHRPPDSHHIHQAIDPDGTTRWITARLTRGDGDPIIHRYITLDPERWNERADAYTRALAAVTQTADDIAARYPTADYAGRSRQKSRTRLRSRCQESQSMSNARKRIKTSESKSADRSTTEGDNP